MLTHLFKCIANLIISNIRFCRGRQPTHKHLYRYYINITRIQISILFYIIPIILNIIVKSIFTQHNIENKMDLILVNSHSPIYTYYMYI